MILENRFFNFVKQNKFIESTIIKRAIPIENQGSPLKLIMKTEFDNLRTNPQHQYQSDVNSGKQVVKIFSGGLLIAKMIKLKKSIRYFGIKGYEIYLLEDDI